MSIGARPLNVPIIDSHSSYNVALAAFVAILYRFTNIDDIVFAVSDYSNSELSSYSYIRYNVPETPLPFSQLYTSLQHTIAQSQQFASVDELNKFLTKQVELSHSQLRDFNNYSFNKTSGSSDLVQNTNDLFEFAINYNSNDNTFSIAYNTEKYSDERISILIEQFHHFFAAVAQDQSAIVTKISLLTDSQTKILPDPTKDLDWSGYLGAIHEIFERNALKWPSRTCVIETSDLQGLNNRVFTYQQINESSNIIAHFLVAQGIQVGDIVTIYSSRSVELLICVLGILKAGGTFSVIDPAYPALRQNIYLSVAKPAGLIVIGKAGKLDQVVEDYISENLQLKARLNEVVLQDNGIPLGGTADYSSSADVLEQYIALKEKSTGVKVGPDSHPTLAFTSGSEGIPKGVLGRHFSLAYYFPWMAKTFNLSEKDNFTMLSGIAHDPVQRDMFTPIFLGAKLLIPTADDIGTPGRLAKWMQVNDITVTHLTPAMGQVLASQAVDEIPSLKNAFFVGDLLTRKDCLRLQSLAKNVNIINMYGTTETQRAVSYFLVKSFNEDRQFLFNLKDIIPAGQGMKNVQLLVVNRSDQKQTCGIGEVGELFVRAGGLAEGYRGLPKYNAEKFVTNWFVNPQEWITKDAQSNNNEEWRQVNWKGPRDRLYRTGDLGRYLPDGNVEVTGRIDDQIKIRGFRIELGEIDTHVSKFPVVRENRTIVKKDENNENYLISYLVLRSEEQTAIDEFLSDKFDDLKFEENDDIRLSLVQSLTKYHKLASALKKFLTTKLASYAVPSIVVVVPKFPLNPNGKIDKNKLPVPTSEELAEATKYLYQLDGGASGASGEQEQFTELQSKIKDIWFNVLPNKPIISSVKDSFFDLGGHSILATRMIFQVRKQFNVDLPLGTIFKNPTIELFALQVENLADASTAAATAGSTGATATSSNEYSKDAEFLSKTKLASSYPSLTNTKLAKGDSLNVFITGTTGFLGSFLVKEFLTFAPLNVKVFAHVRAESKDAGLARLVKALKTYDNYNETVAQAIEAQNKVEVVVGDLSKSQFGLSNDEWSALNDQVDVIVHNGAMVHWVYPYAKLRDANVLSTINVFNMTLQGKPKTFQFISSTSTLDTQHYFDLADGVPESDSLTGSAQGLGTGYGQSKWAAEHIIRQAGNKGLKGYIIRPGYITGASNNGASNTDDFLLRMLKGCIEVGSYPKDITNKTNAVPVDHVARIVLATSLSSIIESFEGVKVAHVTGRPRIPFNEYLSSVNEFGYNVNAINYSAWKTELENFVTDTSINKGQESALFPLLHMVLGDLVNDTKAPELDDSNTIHALLVESQFSGREYRTNAKGQGLNVDQLGVYLSYLVQVGFLPKPEGDSELPKIELSDESLQLAISGAGGRGSAAK